MDTFKFPDEQKSDAQKSDDKKDDVQFEIEGDNHDIEVVDDTPEPDRGRKPMTDTPAEVTDEELAQYSEGVKKRIQHFSKGYHEERRAKEAAHREKEEAIRLAQNLLEENQRLQSNLGQGQQALLEQAKKTVAGEIEQAKAKLREAHEKFDTEAIIAAQEELTAAKIKAERVNSFKPVAQPQAPVVQPATQAAAAPPDPGALAWQEANPWFGKNRRMTAVALEIHQELAQSGVTVGSPDYYQKIDAELRSTFPGALTQEEKPRKQSVVAAPTRSTAPKKIVLTQTAVNLAKRLGLTNEQYARAVAEELRKQNG
jgi:hypothetical protein